MQTRFSKDRLVRFAFALALGGAIASLVPTRSGVVLAKDGYPQTAGGIFDVNGTNGVGAVVLTGLGAGAARSLGGLRHGALASTPIYDVYRNHMDDFTEVVRLIDNADLENFYRESSPHTVLLPNDSQLVKSLGREALRALQSQPKQEEARAFLRARTLNGSYSFSRLVELAKLNANLTTLDGHTLPLHLEGERLFIGKVEVLSSEYPASNGFILVTDSLLTFEEDE